MIPRAFSLKTLILPLLLAVAGCSGEEDKGALRLSVIGEYKHARSPLTHIDTRAGAISFAATAQGLVSYNEAGNVVPALAQRWIVVDDGKSYIFRLRRARWVGGDRVDAREVMTILKARVREARKADPYGPMASIAEILAMTADVIEIRLRAPRPDFLVAMAAPDMGIARSDGGTGPYRKTPFSEDEEALLLTPVTAFNAPQDQQVPEHERRILFPERASKAIARFKADRSSLVLGGTLAELPYISLAEIDRNAVRFDPVSGLFGLALSRDTKMLDDAQLRNALSMAIEREAIIAYFEMNRWVISSQMLPQQLDLSRLPSTPEWLGMTLQERRNLASAIVTRWRSQNDDKPVKLRIALPKGPGMALLFLALKLQFKSIGVEVEQVEKDGDLTLIDEVAPYDSVAWYLGRLSCKRGVHCSNQSEELLQASLEAETMEERLELLEQAEQIVQAHNGFIPLATPVRWSLTGPRIDSYVPTRRGFHDLRGLEK